MAAPVNLVTPRYIVVKEPTPPRNTWRDHLLDLVSLSPIPPSLTSDLYELYRRAQLSNLGVTFLTQDEISSLLFAPGHPQPKVIYVVHPFDQTRYIPYATFHRSIFEQKVIEALELLAALGAVTVQVKQISGNEEAKHIAASLPLASHLGVDASVGLTSKSTNHSAVVYEASLRPSARPSVPNHLQWFVHEEFWQSVARLRLQSGLLTFSLGVRHQADFGVTAKLGAKFSGLGLELGGSYSDFSMTHWEMSGEFAPMSINGELT